MVAKAGVGWRGKEGRESIDVYIDGRSDGEREGCGQTSRGRQRGAGGEKAKTPRSKSEGRRWGRERWMCRILGRRKLKPGRIE